MPYFSVIIPVYNTKKYLPQCLKSLLRQSFSDFEVLLVDDGSTDGSGALCDQYEAKDERIKVIHQENRGLGEARNTGLNYITGEWVLFLDSDDYWAEDGLQQLWDGMTRWPGNTLYITQWRTFYNDAENLKMPNCAQPFPQEGVVVLDNLKEKVQFYNDHYGWAVWKLVFSRSLIREKELRFLPEVRNGEDLYWMLHLLERVNAFCCLDTVLCCYRNQERGTLSELSSLNALCWMDSLEKTINQIFAEEFDEKEFIIAWLLDIDSYYLCLAADIAQKKEWMDKVQRHVLLFHGVKKKGSFLSKRSKLIKYSALFGPKWCWLSCRLFRTKVIHDNT